MKVTLLGHASVLVEMDGARALMDPVFEDPFEEGAVVSCPRRKIDVTRLGPIDLLVLSHAHLDHFDIASLAKVPRSCDVLCPKDHAILYVLAQLGFTRVHDSDAMTHIKFPAYEILTTRSHVSNVIEFGVVFKDKSGTFWNQVDTVLKPETIAATKAQVGDIDLLFAMYASQNFEFFASRGLGFPHATHAMNLGNAAAIAPRMVVPGSAGFRFADAVEWCNAFLFPVSRERFVTDLARVAPALRTQIANPGDMFEIDRGVVRHLAGASNVATMLEEDTARLRFDPTAAVPPLRDPNPDGYSEERIAKTVAECVEGLTTFLRAAYAGRGDEVVEQYRTLGATYALGVVFPDGHETRWLVVFAETEARVEIGAPTSREIDSEHRIAASALTAWASREKSYFYYRAHSRMASTLYAVTRVDQGSVSVDPRAVPDLLGYYLQRRAKGAETAMKQRLDFQLRAYLSASTTSR